MWKQAMCYEIMLNTLATPQYLEIVETTLFKDIYFKIRGFFSVAIWTRRASGLDVTYFPDLPRV